MEFKWQHNKHEDRWELVRPARPVDFDGDDVLHWVTGVEENREPIAVCWVSDEFVAGMDLGLEGLRKILGDSHPDWPRFPSEAVRKGKAEASE